MNITFGTPSGVAVSTDSYTTFANTSAEVTLFSQVIPGGQLSLLNQMKFAFYLNLSTMAVLPGTITFRIKYNGSVLTLGGGALTLVSAKTNSPVRLSGILTNIGSFSSQYFNAELRQDGNTLSLISPIATAMAKPTVDSTIDQTFSLTVQFSTANAANTVTLDYASMVI